MKITHFTDYGFRTLIFLGVRQKMYTPMPMIANQYNISSNHLMKVSQQLVRLGYIESKHGRSGGLRLIKDPRKVKVSQVFRELESLEIVNCFSAYDTCIISSSCHLKNILNHALHAFIQELDKYTLADLIDNPDELFTHLSLK